MTVLPKHHALIRSAEEIATAAGVLLAVEITTDEAEAKAAEMVVHLRRTAKILDAAREEAKAPHLAAGREVDAAFAIVKGLKRLDELFAGALGRRAAARDAERRRLEAEAARAAAEGAAEQANALVLEAHDPVFAPVTAAVADAGLTASFTWRAVVEDIDALPRAWMVPDFAALDAHARNAGKAGAEPKPIPGVRFEREATMRMGRR